MYVTKNKNYKGLIPVDAPKSHKRHTQATTGGTVVAKSRLLSAVVSIAHFPNTVDMKCIEIRCERLRAYCSIDAGPRTISYACVLCWCATVFASSRNPFKIDAAVTATAIVAAINNKSVLLVLIVLSTVATAMV
jgi:hypothetical protein